MASSQIDTQMFENTQAVDALLVQRRHRDTGASARNTFIIEALLLLAIVVILVAAAMAIFAQSLQMGKQSALMNEAMVIAQNTAERFMANPTLAVEHEGSGNYIVECITTAEDTGSGTMYTAEIYVFARSQGGQSAKTDDVTTVEGESAKTDDVTTVEGESATDDQNTERDLAYSLSVNKYVSDSDADDASAKDTSTQASTRILGAN